MISAYHSVVNYEEDNWSEYLDNILLLDIFMPVIKEYINSGTLKSVIRYIVYAYSPESDKVILGMDWLKNKQKVFEFVLAKPENSIYQDLVLLKNKAVVNTIHKWLNFLDNDTFTQLQVIKDLRVEMQISSLTEIRKASGEIDYDQKYRNASYANDLKKMIKDLESELIQNNNKLKDAIKEVKSAKNKFNVGPETFSK